jgi:hypothetical protein
MSNFKDFLGLNRLIYDPTGMDLGTPNSNGSEENLIGYHLDGDIGYIESDTPNSNITSQTRHAPRETIVLLNLHRNGPYGYPTWKQIRASENHLTRAQRKSNIFTYQYDGFKTFKEPVLTDSHKPISLIGDIKTYNDKTGEFQNRSVELKTSFGNETSFFANKLINQHFETIVETDDNYEQLKDLYLDGGLEDEGSPIDSFNMFIYRQSIYPKQQFSYLNKTRSRTFFENSFWKTKRTDRTRTDVSSGFGATLPSQSMWPLDVGEDWADRDEPTIAGGAFDLVWALGNGSPVPPVPEFYFFNIGGSTGTKLSMPNADLDGLGGFNTGENLDPLYIGAPTDIRGGAGVLMNSYSQIARGYYNQDTSWPHEFVKPIFEIGSVSNLSNYLSASCYYSKRHTINSIKSVVSPTGMEIKETGSMTHIPTGSLFEGLAAWDCAKQASATQGVDKSPFYDSYDKYAEELRLSGKGFSIVPEFRISNHVEKFYSKGVTQELKDIFELKGGMSPDSNTSNENSFYKVLSTSDFLKHFDLVKDDHKSLAKESIITLRCKAKKKFLPYDGFYPAQATVDLAKTFYDSYKNNIYIENSSGTPLGNNQLGIQSILEPFFAPGVLFNTIKSGVAVDYPIVLAGDNPVNVFVDSDGKSGDNADFDQINSFLCGSDLSFIDLASRSQLGDEGSVINSIFSTRVNFESLVEPDRALKNLELTIQETHPFGLSEAGVKIRWDGYGKDIYIKKANNFLAESVDFFMQDSQLKTIASMEDGDPNFGNVVKGFYYTARIKMFRSLESPSEPLVGIEENSCFAPQTIGARESLTMYSRPSAFGIPVWGSDHHGPATNGVPLGASHGSNYCFTPPYYHGEAWCDIIFKATKTGKVGLDEILQDCEEFPYYSRFWDPYFGEPIRDLTGYQDLQGDIQNPIGPNSKYSNYTESAWRELINIDQPEITAKINDTDHSTGEIPTGAPIAGQWVDFFADTSFNLSNGVREVRQMITPHHPVIVNYNAMQLDSSLNLFSKGTIKKIKADSMDATIEVASSDTIKGKTRWIIQPKFESPILNFNKYNDLSDPSLNCTSPRFASESVPRGMWHQYGSIPSDPSVGVFMQVEDIPESWLIGALGLSRSTARNKVKSLADVVGFSKDPVRLGEVADVKEISEAVVAVPFIEKDGTRQFFSIPRQDIDSCIEAVKREVEEGTFVAGGPPKAGDSVYQMVKKMQKYVFPPSMDFVRYKEIDPFAMYVFEFKHNLTKQDLADIWQNLPPEIGTKMEEAEASISHELLAHELLGGGSVVKNGVLDDNAEGKGIPSNIQWMIFKAKKRAKTNYFDKVVAKKGTTEDTSSQQLENAQGQTGDDLGITYNWPYDFFSLVELVKIDAEVTFANIENDDKGQKTIKKVERKNPLEVAKSRAVARGVNLARGKGRPKK